MDILFISRRSSHSKYFKKLSDALNINSHVYIMGKIQWSSILLFFQLPSPSLVEVIDKQLARKTASHPSLFRLSLIRRLYRELLCITEKLRWAHYINLYNQVNPKRIALWNGQKLPNATPVLSAKYLNIPVVYFENGLLPNTVTVDHKGVNELNSLPRTPEFYIFASDTEKSLLPKQIAPRAFHKHKKHSATIKLPNQYIFVPLQVPNDTQIISNSPWIDSMSKFVKQVELATNHLPSNIKVVVKEHPSWPQPFTLYGSINERILFANDNSTQQLIENAQAVITINSTVGIESLLLDKKVITLGKACYNIKGLVLHASDSNELKACINRVSTWQPDEQLRVRFLRFLQQTYCIPTRWAMADRAHFLQVEQRILKQDKFSKILIEASK